MILEGKTDTLLMEDGEVQDSTKMQIDEESHTYLMRMLSKFYSDGVGSLIRETCSNALDSHRECAINEPIIVSFTHNKDNNYEFSVQDFGCGIDDQDVANIISKYGKSTKRLSVTQLGAFGLGFKSPLAYTPAFYFIGRKGGIERKWMLYESDDESNKIDLLYEAPTIERNGVKVIVPVKYGDRSEFYGKIKEQLAYFESVYFNCGYEIKNEDVKIVRSDLFQWSSLTRDRCMHVCLDNVYYPIDYAKLGIGAIDFPVGLRFSLTDGLFPIPNREQLKYTKEAKAIILKKIGEVAEYFVNKYNDTIKGEASIYDIVKYYQSSSRLVPHLDGKGMLDVRNLEYHCKVKFLEPKLGGVKYLDAQKVYAIRDHLFQEYAVKYTLENKRFNLQKNNSYRWRTKLDFRNVSDNTIYIFSDLTGLKKIYFRETLGNKYCLFAKKENKIPLGNVKYRYTGRGYDNYVSLLGLWNYPKAEWRERIKELQYIMSLLTSKFIDVDKIDIPQEWLDARKKERLQLMAVKGTNVRRQKLTGEVTGKKAASLERYVSGKNCKFVPITIQMKDAEKSKKFTIYGGTEDEATFQRLYTVLKKDQVQLIVFSDREFKNLKEIKLHNWMEIGKFMEGKHRIFRRAVTAYLISQLGGKYYNVFNRAASINEISTPLADKITRLKKYAEMYHMSGDKELYDAMIKVAEDKKLFDYTMYDVYKEVEYILNRLPFVEAMFSRMTYSKNNDLIAATRDLFKYYKQRIDWQHYHLPINEEPVVETAAEEIEENKSI